MNAVNVLEIFYTSIGEIAILTFPDDQHPIVGMKLRRDDGAVCKITGISMPTSSEMTNGYYHFNPPRLIFDCKVEAQTIESKLKAGDSLLKN